jgi:hypothetical protein
MLGIRLRDALVSQSRRHTALANAPGLKPRETHAIGEHLVYVGVHGHSLVIRRLLPTVPIAERLKGVVDEL